MERHQPSANPCDHKNWEADWSAVNDMGPDLAKETAKAAETLRKKVLYRIVFAILGAYWIGVLLSTQSAILTIIFATAVLVLAIDVMTGLKVFGSVFGFGAVVNGFPNVELVKILGIGGPVQLPDFQLKKAVEEGWKLTLKTVIVPMASTMVILGLLLCLFAFFPPAQGKGVLYALVMPPFFAIVIGALTVVTSKLDPKKEPVKAKIRNVAYAVITLFAAVSFFGIYDGKGKAAEVAGMTGQRPFENVRRTLFGYRIAYEVPKGTKMNTLPPIVLPKDMEPGLYEVEVEGNPRLTLKRPTDREGTVGTENYSLRGEQPTPDLPRRDYGTFGMVIGGVIPGESTFISGKTLSIGLNMSDAYAENFDSGIWKGAMTPLVITLKKR